MWRLTVVSNFLHISFHTLQYSSYSFFVTIHHREVSPRPPQKNDNLLDCWWAWRLYGERGRIIWECWPDVVSVERQRGRRRLDCVKQHERCGAFAGWWGRWRLKIKEQSQITTSSWNDVGRFSIFCRHASWENREESKRQAVSRPWQIL